MATFLNETYQAFSARLTDWLNTAGGEVADLTLDLINRAQYRLSTYRAWDGLITHYSITLTNKAATLPADFYGAVCRVYIDTNTDLKPELYYHRDAPAATGYRIVNTFTKAVGHVWTITFFSDPTYSPVLVYPKALPDFEGTGTEYSFFPPELLLAAAKVVHIEESDLIGDEYKAVQTQYLTLLRDYEQSHQHQNVEQRMAQIDQNGEELFISGYDLNGGESVDATGNFDNDYDLG